ncbi:MAG TPA: branched-chain amino acid ABC transporter permease [Arenicellales bacterium]|nr:branched-chain amino acid ABC transporter permease [Arenicellales bacterium]
MSITSGKYIVLAVVLGFLLVVPFTGVYPIFMMKLLCFALFATAFNLVLGYVGLLSFGHAAFFGMAAYFTGHMVKEWVFPTEIGILLGALGAGALGFVVASLATRRSGIYFAMITLALAQMVFFFCVQAPFTYGEDGIQGIPRGTFLGIVDLSQINNMYYFVLGVCVLGFLAIYRTVHSPFGEVLKAIRENETRVVSLGYNVTRFKVAAFTISATISGLAGATKSIVFQSATLTDVHWTMSGEVVLMTLLGGMGTLFGPAAGAVVVVTLQNYLAGFGAWITIITGSIFVACVLMFRRGIIGELDAYIGRRKAAPQAPAEPEKS